MAIDENMVAEDQQPAGESTPVQQYNDVDTSEYNISDESSSPVEDSSEKTTESTLNENRNIVNSDEEQSTNDSEDGWDANDYELDIDGETYSMNDIVEWKKDSSNKDSWQKSNTEKAQNLSQLGKLFERVQGDDNFKSYIKDYFHDNPQGLKDSGLEQVDWDNIPEDLNPEDQLIEDDPHNQLMERVESLETDKNVQILEAQLDQLESKFPQILGGQKTDNFLQFVDESGIGDLEVGFRLWATDSLLAQSTNDRKLDENRQRNNGKIIDSSELGAKSVVMNSDQYKGQKGKAWNKITLDDPEVSKYFDN